MDVDWRICCRLYCTLKKYVSKKMHLDYVCCFSRELELMHDYFPGRTKVKQEAFATLMLVKTKGKRRLRNPASL